MKLIFAIAALAVSLAVPAWAQTRNCASRDVIVAALEDKYGETVLFIGMTGPDGIMEIWANTDTGSWTALISSAAGLSCVASSGDGFETVREVLEPTGLKL